MAPGSSSQTELFPVGQFLPEGFHYREEFLSPELEAQLLAGISGLTLAHSRYRQWTAKRRTVSFGGHYDFTHLQLHAAEPVPQFLHPLRDDLAAWAGVNATSFTHASIAEYPAGTQLGWHRDVPDFEIVVGVSLQGVARMRFRPYPPSATRNPATCALDLAPRSAYIIRDEARWKWQHAISPTRELRYSITFRTLRKRPG
jgi:alkylated DNA repair dioxygenase AlkB